MVSVRNFRSYGADIYGWTGSKETPCTKKNMCLAPLSTIFISPLQKKAGDSGPLKSKRFALLTEFFLFCVFFWRDGSEGAANTNTYTV